MDTTLYKKVGIATLGIARDLILSNVGDKCPTISECTEKFGVSRGTIQEAFAILESSGSVVTEKRGKKGAIIQNKDDQLLYQYAQLDSITASMPTPLNQYLMGLATAICRSMGKSSAPFTFAFIQGAYNRVKALRKNTYDMVITSYMAAKNFLTEYNELEIAMILNDCLYSKEYVIVVNSPNVTGLRDGMTFGFDPTCSDQLAIINRLSCDYDLKLLKVPYASSRFALKNHTVDAIVYRREAWLEQFASKITILPAKGYKAEMDVPVILVNKQNYGMDRLIRSFLDEKECAQIQNAVIDGSMEVQLY